jgi:hypothetical protein
VKQIRERRTNIALFYLNEASKMVEFLEAETTIGFARVFGDVVMFFNGYKISWMLYK